ncbi:MAG: asparagine synthetase B family protein [Aeromicrobium sp.]
MSGFAAHLDFVDGPTAERLRSIADKIAYRGPQGQATRNVGACTLMHATLWTTAEAEHENQPQRHATRDVWLAADARVDNRAELTEMLDGAVQHPLRTDADFLLAAYEQWGADLVDRVVGDFAFALWDGELEELLVARDPVGVRPLFLAQTPNGVVAASTLPAVLAGIDGEAGIDETYLAGFLHGLPPRDRTIWSGVERLAPGHRVRIGRDRVVTERYWMPSLEPLRQPLETTVELMRTVFDEAVRCRLRTRDGIACDLSGGLDSSTVTATTAELATEVHTVSLVYRLDSEAFELPHIEAVADHLGLRTNLIEADELTTLDPVADIRTQREPLYSIDATDTAALFDRASALGCSVSLAGVGGDELLYGSTPDRRGIIRQRVSAATVRWAVSRPDGLVARAVLARRARRARRDRPWLRVSSPLWPVLGRLSSYEAPWGPPGYELTDRLAAERGVEVRYPFLDRRLIELGLRLPDDHVRAGDDSRGLHRLAFGQRLPDAVAARTDKAEFTGSFSRRIGSSLSSDDVAAALAALDDRIDVEVVGSAAPWYRWVAVSAGLFVSSAFARRSPKGSDTFA